jgi:hypothetical protein
MEPDTIKDPITRFAVTGNNAVERAGEKESILRKETEIVDFHDRTTCGCQGPMGPS